MSNIYVPTEIVRLYRVWTNIIYRCNRPENKQFKNYGERGIFICEEWLDFNNFCRDVYKGSKSGLHLDRIDNDDGYYKNNVRWTTPKVNHRNKKNNHYYETHLGTMAQSELIENMKFTRKQFQRAIEKYGEKKLLKMFKENTLPTKRVNPDLNEIVNKKFNNFLVIGNAERESYGIYYKCQCDCGKIYRVSRHRLINRLSKYCKSCGKKGHLNPKNKTFSKLKQP